MRDYISISISARFKDAAGTNDRAPFFIRHVWWVVYETCVEQPFRFGNTERQRNIFRSIYLERPNCVDVGLVLVIDTQPHGSSDRYTTWCARSSLI